MTNTDSSPSVTTP